ncbi:SMP-30/gluconolactonase/LRE family protein [Luteimonas sp. RD2P54]|uniref:SMP-30/gluconolactonase/LRE family protein n=1 Tax=Luteimonas endophytica TaxID=3042023 RepID=A0ABT6JAQ5_9GAMM|nr:SMP-30/gluconolactonase/LRE family protein [Luteimonas endophytica]MDH5823258.1 SMP-30/gluconolactonase/LRE family protein [Luteimonas endophytica]
MPARSLPLLAAALAASLAVACTPAGDDTGAGDTDAESDVPTAQAPAAPAFDTVGRLTAYDDAFAGAVPPDARIEKLTDERFTWSEGPAWIEQGGYLLFNDVPENRMYRWSEADGLSVFLEPSGYAGPDDGTLREAGANGLFPEPGGTVLLADSGSRLVARLDPASKEKTTLASSYEGKRFNSPNDVVRRADGTVFFTDPPYGLKGMDDSPAKELAFNGVYRIDADGGVHLVDDGLSFPNGVALAPDGNTLYVANSDPERPIWMAYALDEAGNAGDGRVFADASDLVGDDAPGLPDGMAVAADGTLFATGPGGVLVFAPDGTRLGRIETGTAVANCALAEDGRVLYMTSHRFLARVRLR